ncbi:hypothetical protein BDV23DRAFT_157619 [Aspergillus alliaceus]|uniref:Uncharacterized protein n=1 Tax=Petromyces alliaceus TaxID=209559 RepID=A0A5N7C4U3_PETAA|nr:hypothetical protein BDV23DRAFT_157619 [Aspergillus alliaceus]
MGQSVSFLLANASAAPFFGSSGGALEGNRFVWGEFNNPHFRTSGGRLEGVSRSNRNTFGPRAFSSTSTTW